MIIEMKKITVVSPADDRDDTVRQMRRLGVLHINASRIAVADTDDLIRKKARFERALAVIPEAEGPEEDAEAGDADEMVDAVLALGEERHEIHEQISQLKREESRIAPWGEFVPADIEFLRNNGVTITLFSAPRRELASFEGRYLEIGGDKNTARCASITLRDEDTPNFESIPVPAAGPSELRGRIEELITRLGEIENELCETIENRTVIESAITDIDEEIELRSVSSQFQGDEQLSYITGFVPVNSLDTTREYARQAGWGILIQDTDPDDEPPTLIRNPRWVRIIQPVFDLLGTVPGYRELDISFWFLIFFTVFFAMIIGDAGYGGILLAGSIYAGVKAKRAKKPVSTGVILLSVLSVATILWGAVTGTWFGSERIARSPVLSWAIIDEIAIFEPRSAANVQWLCFVLGTVHLTIAHVWSFLRAVRSRPRIRAIEQLGWLSMVLGLYYLVLSLVLGTERFPMPDYALPMIIGGFVAVLLFSGQEAGKGFVKGVVSGVANFMPNALNSISAFSDIISYIRLFAVGLATVEIAKSFNSMAAGTGDGLFGIAAAVIILFVGHTLNLAMAALSVVVHGVRLNMLEFSGHLGMEWSGEAYRPFREHINEETQE